MKAQASPIIKLEMNDWEAAGGRNFGILGAYDGSHPTGFHRAGFEVPTSDYSRRHDPGKPYDLSWGCAGDFAHVGVPRLRALQAGIVARLMADDPSLRMIVEFIGMPWADQPVMYWARWDGVKTLKRYTGKGHDTWSHISWQRSIANQRAYLWSSAGSTSPVNGEDDMRFVLVDGLGDEPGQVWLSNMMFRRRVTAGWDISSTTYFHPNLFGTGGSLGNGGKVFHSAGDPDLWGVDIAALGGGTPAAAMPLGNLRLDVTGTLSAAAAA